MMSKLALPYLLKGENPKVLNLSPPLDSLHPAGQPGAPDWFRLCGSSYTMSKFNMSMSAIGMAEEFRGKVAFNCLWPRTAIATSAVQMLAGSVGMNASRTVDIMSDSAHWILTQDSSVSGNCFIDDDVITDPDKLGRPASVLSGYRYRAEGSAATADGEGETPLMPDFFVGEPATYEKFRAAFTHIESANGNVTPAQVVMPAAASTEPSLAGKTLFITGGSRGIGLAIAKRAARDGANLVLAAKTAEPHPKLPGTIFTAAAECEEAGGQALPLQLNVQDDAAIEEALKKAEERFGRIDILINNASAIDNSGTLSLKPRKYDLMHSINGRGTYMMSKLALPYLLKGENPHVLNLSPPLALHPKWLKMGGVGYSLAKFNMSMSAIGMAEEFRGKVAFNCLWPRTAIATAAVQMLGGSFGMNASRTVDIMSDSAHWILTQDSSVSGNCFIDDEIITDPDKLGRPASVLSEYRYNRWLPIPLIPDLYVGEPESLEWFHNAAKLVASGTYMSAQKSK